MRLIIKNMVCARCITSVADILNRNGVAAKAIHLGEVELEDTPDPKQLGQIAEDLKATGFELLDDHRMQLIEQARNLLTQKVQSGNIEEHFGISKYIGENIFRDYSSVSKLFSEVVGTTIEQFFIQQKIEKAKEWLIYNELSLGQIALNLGYSSTQHLSSQFRRVTGMTPSQFRHLGGPHRKNIDTLKS